MARTLPDGFATSCLRGAGQVFFQENALSGAIFLVAIGYASFAGGTWATTAGALLGLAVATGTAYVIDVGDRGISQGMYGFNGILVGIALPTFLAPTPAMWACLVVGAAVSTVVMDAFTNVVTRSWGVAASTGPFVLTTWLLVAAAYAFARLPPEGLGSPQLPRAATDALGGLSPLEVLRILLRNVGQVFLLGNAGSGALILLGLLVSSAPAAVAAVVGSAVALVTASALGADPGAIRAGLFGFSPVLTAIAIGVVFLETSTRVVFFALLATIFTVIVQGAMNTVVAPLGIPTFTAPYVLVMWLFTLPKKELEPHPHAPSSSARIGG